MLLAQRAFERISGCGQGNRTLLMGANTTIFMAVLFPAEARRLFRWVMWVHGQGWISIRNVPTSSCAEERVMVDDTDLYPIANCSPGLCFHNSLVTIHSWNSKKNTFYVSHYLLLPLPRSLKVMSLYFLFLLSLMLHHPCTLKQV